VGREVAMNAALVVNVSSTGGDLGFEGRGAAKGTVEEEEVAGGGGGGYAEPRICDVSLEAAASIITLLASSVPSLDRCCGAVVVVVVVVKGCKGGGG